MTERPEERLVTELEGWGRGDNVNDLIPIARAMAEVVKAAKNVSLPEPVRGQDPSWDRADFDRLRTALQALDSLTDEKLCGATDHDQRVCTLPASHPGGHDWQFAHEALDSLGTPKPSMTDEEYSEYLGTHYGGRDDSLGDEG